jgi:hypothetical protein
MAFSFNKVTKLIDGGPFEGISSFYRAVPVIMKHSSGAVAPTPKFDRIHKVNKKNPVMLIV